MPQHICPGPVTGRDLYSFSDVLPRHVLSFLPLPLGPHHQLFLLRCTATTVQEKAAKQNRKKPGPRRKCCTTRFSFTLPPFPCASPSSMCLPPAEASTWNQRAAEYESITQHCTSTETVLGRDNTVSASSSVLYSTVVYCSVPICANWTVLSGTVLFCIDVQYCTDLYCYASYCTLHY